MHANDYRAILVHTGGFHYFFYDLFVIIIGIL